MYNAIMETPNRENAVTTKTACKQAVREREAFEIHRDNSPKRYAELCKIEEDAICAYYEVRAGTQ